MKIYGQTQAVLPGQSDFLGHRGGTGCTASVYFSTPITVTCERLCQGCFTLHKIRKLPVLPIKENTLRGIYLLYCRTDRLLFSLPKCETDRDYDPSFIGYKAREVQSIWSGHVLRRDSGQRMLKMYRVKRKKMKKMNGCS